MNQQNLKTRQPMELIGPIALIELRNYQIHSQIAYVKLVTSVVCSYTGYNPVFCIVLDMRK